MFLMSYIYKFNNRMEIPMNKLHVSLTVKVYLPSCCLHVSSHFLTIFYGAFLLIRNRDIRASEIFTFFKEMFCDSGRKKRLISTIHLYGRFSGNANCQKSLKGL